MSSLFATFLCWCGIAGLFYLDRDKSTLTSKSLWLPIIWIWINGSRPVSEWITVAPTAANLEINGSPMDAAVFGILTVAAIAVLTRRSRRLRAFLLVSLPILIYFTFCLISVTWSYHSDVALKRWVKSIGDLVMILVVVTDKQPVAAIRRLIFRSGAVLLPASVLLIRYYGDLGRAWDIHGVLSNVGVTTNKNSLGLIVFVISLGAAWNVRSLLANRLGLNWRRRLAAQSVLLALGVELLAMAHSSTSIACFFLGSVLMLATRLHIIGSLPSRVHLLCLSIFVAGGSLLLLGGTGDVAGVLGRQSTLTGRTDIWAAVIPAASNPIVGSGFESFWISPNAQKFWNTLRHEGWYEPQVLNEAHNGYIEVYLNLGWIGVILIALILISGYLRACKAFQRNPEIGSIMLAYVITGAFYSITEAGFRMLNPMWIFLLLAIVSTSGVNGGLFGSKSRKIRFSRGQA